MENNKSIDITVYGATGFTGKYILEELMLQSLKESTPIRIGAAGRSLQKLNESVAAAAQYANYSQVSSIQLIQADCNDAASLNRMAQKSRVIINCVGPYELYAEPVIRACVANHAHHVDISCELHFMQRVQSAFQEEALQRGVYIVQACGYFPMITDMAVLHMTREFPGQLNSIEAYHTLIKGDAGYKVNIGTYTSTIQAFKYFLPSMRYHREHVKSKLPKPAYPLKSRLSIFRSELTDKGWCFPFDVESQMIETSQMLMREHSRGAGRLEHAPIQFATYCQRDTLLEILGFMVFALICVFMVPLGFTRRILENNPEIFSFGFVSSKGSTRKQLDQCVFNVRLEGWGWANRDDSERKPVDTRIRTQVTGGDPGYYTASILAVQSAVTVLRELDQLPSTGGVFSSGAAFFKTSILERIHKNTNLRFSTLSISDSI